MFKVYKSKEAFENNENQNLVPKKDILEDFNNYQNNNQNTVINNNMQQGVNQAIQNTSFNNTNNTIDLNSKFAQSQKEFTNNQVPTFNNFNEQIKQNEYSNDNSINNVEYLYNNELEKHNKIDNIKSIINDQTNNLFDHSSKNTQSDNISFSGFNSDNNALFNQFNIPQVNTSYENKFQNSQFNNNLQSNFSVNNTPFVNNNQTSVSPTIPYEKNTNDNQDLINLSKKRIHSNLFDEDETGYRRCPKCNQKLREDYKMCFVCGTWLD